MNKQALDKGFIDRCFQRGITDPNQQIGLMKVANGMIAAEEATLQKQAAMQKQSAIDWQKYMDQAASMANTPYGGAAIGGLGGAAVGGLGAGLGGGSVGQGMMYGGAAGAGLGLVGQQYGPAALKYLQSLRGGPDLSTYDPNTRKRIS